MESLIGGAALLVLLLGLIPAGRGVQAGIEAFGNPGKPETPKEQDRANSDLVRMLVLVVAVFALMFVWTMGGGR